MIIKVYDKKNNILIGEGREISNKIISFTFNNLDGDFIVCLFNMLEPKIKSKYKKDIVIKIEEEK
jgi:hypothetical protein